MDTGLRKMIYIPNKEIWQGIQTAARMDGRSVSNYLVMLHQVFARAGDTKSSHRGFINEAGSISEEVYENIKPVENRNEVTSKIQTTPRSFSKDSQLGKKGK
jgi:hypothetical protein